jgi:DNA-binding protein HU-beta
MAMAITKSTQITKSDLIDQVVKSTGATKSSTEATINAMLETIMAEVVKGHDIKLTGFATISKVKRAARNGVNPKTKEKIKIAASNAVSVKVGKTFKDAVKAS